MQPSPKARLRAGAHQTQRGSDMTAGMSAIGRALEDEAIIKFMEENIDIWSLHRISKKRGTPTERQLWNQWKARALTKENNDG